MLAPKMFPAARFTASNFAAVAAVTISGKEVAPPNSSRPTQTLPQPILTDITSLATTRKVAAITTTIAVPKNKPSAAAKSTVRIFPLLVFAEAEKKLPLGSIV